MSKPKKPRVYRCRHCGYEVKVPEIGKSVNIQGAGLSWRLNCPKCGHVIARYPKKSWFKRAPPEKAYL